MMVSIIKVLAVILVFGSLLGCARSYTYRYRLTITVDDNGLNHTGSSVVQVTETAGRGLDTAYPASIRGQATVVDLGNGHKMVALLMEPTQTLLKFYHLPEEWRYGNASGIATLKDQHGVLELTPGDFSNFVTFGDNKNPATAQSVDPKDLASTFGRGVELRRATLEITSDKVTEGLTRQFPWLALGRNYIDGGTSTFDSVGYRTDQFTSGVK